MHAVVAGDSCGHGVNMMGIGHLNGCYRSDNCWTLMS